jgi:hypothetical protein
VTLTTDRTSQKSLNTSLLNLLSHSHASTSSLLAYVTSSPGVHLPIRRAVRHAAFEGTHSDHSSHDEPQHHGPGWAAYVTSLETFRQDLKSIHQLEEELSRVKRDREILVTRLIKNTKSRPSKNDLAAVANGYTADTMSSRASSLSVTSDGSAKESKRAGKLAEAQAELLGCEEHLRGLEVTIEGERNKVRNAPANGLCSLPTGHATRSCRPFPRNGRGRPHVATPSEARPSGARTWSRW